jgi:hypothetical protein
VAEFLASQGLDSATLDSLRIKSQAGAGDFVVVQFGQEVDGLTVYGARVKATFDGDGNLVNLAENLAPVSGFVAPAGIGPRDALDAALADVRPDLATGLSELGRSGKTVTFGGDSSFYSDPTVTTIAIAGPGGALGEGFLVEIWGNEDNELDHVVVNGAGRVVYVQNRTANESYSIFDEHPDAGGQTAGDPADATASPSGWLNPANSDQYPTHIKGYNANTYLDTNGNNIPDGPNFPNDVEETNGTFDAVHDPAEEPTDPANQAVAIQNLFYLNNKIHDVLYGHGFNEAAGNFQDSDPVLAEAQDGSGTNNANFSTPSDGNSPRMQMYLWDGVGNSLVEIAGGPTYLAMIAAFGGNLPVNNKAVVVAIDGGASGSTTDACDGITNAGALAGNIALIDRGNCDFVVKVKAAQDAGALAAIVANNQGNGIITMGGTDNSINIPAVFVGQDDGAAMAAIPPADASLVEAPAAPPMRDSALDGDIVWHEYGHGLTWRMIDNMDALQAPAIGEGMGDALGFIMYDDPAVGEYSTSSPDGIRSEPYDTWESTGRSYEDWLGEEHDDGEIYGAIIWEMWELYKNDGSIGDAQDQIMDDLVAGMTVTAGLYDIWPTFVDMRDGILLTISGESDPETPGANQNRWCHAWNAFAKYGVGTDQVTTQRRRGFRVTLTWASGFAVPVECEAGPGDTTPPAAPTGLAATAGDGTVALDWDTHLDPDNDLDGYMVYRSTVSGGLYDTVLTPSPIAAINFDDTSVVNGVPYYYVVTAVDDSGNESDDSNEASATPSGPVGPAVSMHVENISLSTVNAGQGNKQGRATVTVHNDLGNPVENALVSGTFSGDFTETVNDVLTNASGVATLTTVGKAKGKIDFRFCVDNVSDSLTYLPGINVETCVTY